MRIVMNINDYENMRDYPRYSISLEAYIKSINQKTDGTLKNARINLFDISKSGVGFKSNTKLKKGFFYELNITLWGTNEINCVIQIVREEQKPNKYDYGAIFVGLSNKDKWIIDTYSLLINK